MAHSYRRPALTDTSPTGSPNPEPPSLPSPALPDQRRPTAYRHTRYDAAGRLIEQVTVKDADTSVLVRFAYTRDAAGNPAAIERESGLGTFYYEYDAFQRLCYEGQVT